MPDIDLLPRAIATADAVCRLLIAAIGGAMLGFEREARSKPAGVRAYALVCVGACGLGLLALEVVYLSQQLVDAMVDPSRVIQGIIGSIGFLGAGAIFHSEHRIRGTATGAGIWVAGSAGAALGFGAYFVGIAIIVLSLMIMLVVHALVGEKDEMDAGRSDGSEDN